MNDDGLTMFLLLVALMMAPIGYFFGKNQADKKWQEALPQGQAEFCNTCFDLGADSVRQVW